ncbi:DUF5959 family protein [Streptomyces virginiae]|uniref:DUF5959 family protein n=1 Tax=Streptomyces virginiae TaxID=1961 RepID=UPI00225918CA|nr:DUF5959 family protein [Streptomyces virginiae]MCX4960736.1 DUF5959 family protein [Streptomyces virginiae]
MVEGSGPDLIHMVDGGSSVRLRVLGRHRPGATPYNDYLDAEVIVTSGFADGRLEMCLSPEDLVDWSSALDELAAGRDIHRLRDTEIRIEIDRQFSVPVPIVTVKDDSESLSSVRVRLDVGRTWVDDLREQYELVRMAWPNEVVSSPRSRNYWR